jgi:hypothetical protein
MSTTRIYVMTPLGPGGPWHVSVNGSEGESFADGEAAVRAALDMARSLGGMGKSVEVRQENAGGEWTKVWP